MKVVYVSLLDTIIRLRHEAEEQNRRISKIILTEEEMAELEHEVGADAGRTLTIACGVKLEVES
jgi:hypothetical protein